MCVGFIFWDDEINNDFEDITLATTVNLCITCYSPCVVTSKSA
jgi:hypothetical protein